MKEKLLPYCPAAAAFLTMMAMALTSSTLGFFLEPMCSALEISRSSFSLYFSIMSITSAVVNPFLGQYMGKRGVRGILLLGGAWTGGCFLVLAVVRNLWMLYAVALMMGMISTTGAVLCANVIVQQSYSGARASGILGGVMAGSGVGGMIFNILIPGSMELLGWQGAMRIMGVCWWGLLWMAALLLGKQKKQFCGTGNGAVGLGMTRAQALKSPKLYLMMVISIVVCAGCGIQQQLPSLLRGFGLESGRVSLMISVMTAVLAFGKVFQGILYGKVGVKTGGILMMVVFALGMLAMLLPVLAWAGLLLLALGLGVYTTLLPLIARRIFGSREYPAIWALITTAGSVGTFLANPLWGGIYDVTGSYALGLAGCATLLVCSVLAMLAALKDT